MSRTLEVFEHERLRVGDGELRRHEFDALVRFNDDHGGRFFDVGHLHLRATEFVGYVEVGDVAIEILPKADRHGAVDARPWREGLLEMLRVAGGLPLERLPDASQRMARHSLIELIARAYLAELALLLREGLARGYRSIESNGAVFRGRLNVAEHLRANLARADRFHVRYQTFDHDIAINRVLLAGLEILSWCALSPGVACEVDARMAQLPELSTAGVDATWVDRLHLSRATARYASALTYARMILAQQGPHLRVGRERVFALLFDMNTLWERYVAALVRRAAPAGTRVHTQEQHAFWVPHAHAVRRARPDIVVRGAGDETLLIIDTKWKVPANGLPGDDDLKQMFVYNELLGCARSLLLYPRVGSSFAAGGSYAGRGHACEQRHVGVVDGTRWTTAAALDELRRLMAELLAGPRRA